MNRHMPDAVVFGPLEYGGMGMVETYSLQDQLQVESVLKQVRWDMAMGEAIGVLLDNVQLSLGFVQQLSIVWTLLTRVFW